MLSFDAVSEYVDPFIEHQGERRGFWLRKPKAIGERILIARKGFPVPPSGKGKIVIILDVKSAFGTGGHGTTEGCLIALERFLRGGETVLDVGTGTGILAIAAHKLGAGHVTAIDIDGAACRETERNLALNGIGAGIDVVEGGISAVRDPFDVVVANLRTPILLELMDELAKKRNPRGIAIFSGIMEREIHPFLSFLRRYSLEPLQFLRNRGWMTLVLGNPDAALPGKV